MAHRPSKYESGFTIIETLIVLAIAGIILMFMFLAIPALQRSNRNNQRKQDATAILQAISRYELNNSANFPPDMAFLTDQNVHLSFYDSATDIVLNTSSVSHSPPIPTNAAQVTIYQRYKCSGSGGGAFNDGADYRDIVAMIAIEAGSGGTAPQCIDL